MLPALHRRLKSSCIACRMGKLLQIRMWRTENGHHRDTSWDPRLRRGENHTARVGILILQLSLTDMSSPRNLSSSLYILLPQLACPLLHPDAPSPSEGFCCLVLGRKRTQQTLLSLPHFNNFRLKFPQPPSLFSHHFQDQKVQREIWGHQIIFYFLLILMYVHMVHVGTCLCICPCVGAHICVSVQARG